MILYLYIFYITCIFYIVLYLYLYFIYILFILYILYCIDIYDLFMKKINQKSIISIALPIYDKLYSIVQLQYS